MESSKLLIDVVVYAIFFMMLRFYWLDFKYTRRNVLRAIAFTCYCVTMIGMWIYTYAVIGYAVAELIGRS